MAGAISIEDFLARLASADPVPGGGAVAALNGAMAAALVEMVASLSIGKKGLETHQDRMRAIASECAGLRETLLADIDRDAAAYRKVLAAHRLPKATQDHREKRALAIETAFREATTAPWMVAQKALRLMQLAGEVIANGYSHAAADGAAGMFSAHAALMTAIGNVRSNFRSIVDAAWCDELRLATDHMEREARALKEHVMASHPSGR